MKTINKIFELTEQERLAIEKEIHHYEDPRSASIEALKIIQKNRGWVCDEAIPAIAKILGISEADVEGVATFYSQIYRMPVGKNVIRYCDSMVCYVNGFEKIQTQLETLLKIKPGETTNDKKFTLLPTCCLGKCDKSPAIMINEDTYDNLSTEKLKKILEQYK